MKLIGLFTSIAVAILPMLWLDNYYITNPIWWTVFGAFWIGKFLGLLEAFLDEDNQ